MPRARKAGTSPRVCFRRSFVCRCAGKGLSAVGQGRGAPPARRFCVRPVGRRPRAPAPRARSLRREAALCLRARRLAVLRLRAARAPQDAGDRGAAGPSRGARLPCLPLRAGAAHPDQRRAQADAGDLRALAVRPPAGGALLVSTGPGRRHRPAGQRAGRGLHRKARRSGPPARPRRGRAAFRRRGFRRAARARRAPRHAADFFRRLRRRPGERAAARRGARQALWRRAPRDRAFAARCGRRARVRRDPARRARSRAPPTSRCT